MALAKSRFSNSGGFSLIEVMVATVLLATAVVTLAQLFGLSTRSNLAARNSSYSTILAEQKVEELRALTWGFDAQGLPTSDITTNTAVVPEEPVGGTGLSPSPPSALQENTDGYVDYIDEFGNKLGGGSTPPDGTRYTRRWSISPLPTNPNNTLIIQVLVTPLRDRGDADLGAVARLPEEARIVTAKTRKAQ
jgi:prepilin-type N-terminal cleavage/methylation domain-containing protein